jgi:hypothetical protein
MCDQSKLGDWYYNRIWVSQYSMSFLANTGYQNIRKKKMQNTLRQAPRIIKANHIDTLSYVNSKYDHIITIDKESSC